MELQSIVALLRENIGNIAIITVLVIIMFFSIAFIVKNRSNNKSCSGDCAQCMASMNCIHNQDKNKS